MIVRFQRTNGSRGWGWKNSRGVVDLSNSSPALPTCTRDLIANWSRYETEIHEQSQRLDVTQDPLRLLPPIDPPGKILCIGLNYRDHALETNSPIPDEPIVFNKAPSSLIGPNDPIQIPTSSTQVDFEAELVVVIGKRLKNASESQAAEGIFGYTIGNDVSARDWQKGKPAKQWFLGKSFDTFAPLGPGIIPAVSVPNPNRLRILSRLNGTVMQDSSTSELIFSPQMLLSYISQVLTLEPGDLLFTGTPAGVGVARTPPVFLQPGDRIDVEIESIGSISNPCIYAT